MLVFSLFVHQFCHFTKSYCQLRLFPVPFSMDTNIQLPTFSITKWKFSILSPSQFSGQLSPSVFLSHPAFFLFFVLFPVGFYQFLCFMWCLKQDTIFQLRISPAVLNKIIVRTVLCKRTLLNITVMYYLHCVKFSL